MAMVSADTLTSCQGDLNGFMAMFRQPLYCDHCPFFVCFGPAKPNMVGRSLPMPLDYLATGHRKTPTVLFTERGFCEHLGNFGCLLLTRDFCPPFAA